MKYLVPRIVIIPLILFAFQASAQYHTFYVSPTGSDGNDGLSPATAWQTLSPVNSTDFNAGDSILFEGGKSFVGTIYLDHSDMGTPDLPIVFSSYGNGTATINAGEAEGLMAINAAGIVLNNLIFRGDGLPTNDQQGIYFFMDDTLSDMDFVFMDKLEVYGFGRNGILLESSGTNKGYSNITIQHSKAHDNGISGIATLASRPVFPHKNIHISLCKSYNNYGRSSITTEPTGNGILVSGVDGGIVEYCEAYNNGLFNNCLEEGSGGIVMRDVTNISIQHCESHHNASALTSDGNGFKLEGGTQNTMIQYSYSHDNDGPGYSLHEYGSVNSFVQNLIRYNISQNDARKNRSGAVSIEGLDDAHQITKTDVFNNTIYVSNLNVTNSTPSAIKIIGSSLNGVRIRSNIFYVTSGITEVNATDILPTSRAAFQYNNYFTESGIPNFNWGPNSYSSMNEWKQIATGQEMDGNTELGTTTDPLLYNPGGGLTIRPAEGGDLTTVTAYKLQIMSPVINIGMNQPALGSHDYFNNPTPFNAIVDVGAFEYNGEVLLPVHITSLSGSIEHNNATVRWTVSQQENVVRYYVQRSTDGRHFTESGNVTADAHTSYQFTEHLPAANEMFYYRLKSVHEDGTVSYSGILRLSNKSDGQQSANYIPGSGLQIRLQSSSEEKRAINILDASGRVIGSYPQQLHKGDNLIGIVEANTWPAGVYLVQVAGTNLPAMRFVK